MVILKGDVMFNNHRMCSLIFAASKSSLSSSKHCFYSNIMITYYFIRIMKKIGGKWDVWCVIIRFWLLCVAAGECGGNALLQFLCSSAQTSSIYG